MTAGRGAAGRANSPRAATHGLPATTTRWKRGLVVTVLGAEATLLATCACARTLRVKRDGTGDFPTIQAAVNAAAPADTIWIGPGRYAECAPYALAPDRTEMVCVGVGVERLTLRGASSGAVIIGPAAADSRGFAPKGIATTAAVTELHVTGVTVEHVRDGMYLSGRAVVRHCVARACEVGIAAFTARGASIDSCTFERNQKLGLLAAEPAQEVVASACEFADNAATSVGLDGVAGVVIRDCRVRGGAVGIQFARGASGAIQGCRVVHVRNAGVVLTGGAQVSLQRNVLDGGAIGLVVENRSHVCGAQNMLTGGARATVEFSAGSTAAFHGNHILQGAGALVVVEGYVAAPHRLDLEGNFWGLTRVGAIAAAIRDGRDDPQVRAVADFEPFAPAPFPSVPR